ncbi:hypothetical protein H5T51_07580, partial [Candidatus Bathyarchaeota archaeon]|nr:hypothetical protein [Candidatus Bathyarchaeota archaeon]
MSARLGLVVFLVAVVLSAAFLFSFLSGGGEADEVEVYVGVSFCGNTSAEARLLVDRVKDYTNLFVVLSGPVSYNEAALTEVCDYAVGAGLSVIVFFGDLNERVLELKGLEWRLQWIEMARERWGNKFLGVYYYDEPGGIYIDYEWNSSMLYPRNITLNDLTYDMIAEFYVRLFQLEGGLKFLKDYGVTSFVSDYALYWFDYLAGYDVVLAQVGWNHTFAQDIALVRGAARLQNKSWGIIVTWKYMHPPYLDEAENIYWQMVEAYRCGAKYIVIFNYAEDMSGAYG